MGQVFTPLLPCLIVFFKKMTINKSRGNMYRDYDTWNGMYGRCSHNCLYCYNRKWWESWGEMQLNKRALRDNLGSGKNLFVGSSCDMFADAIPKKWIFRVLEHCNKYPDNIYLFQSKNPKRFQYFLRWFPKNLILGTTAETNEVMEYPKYSEAPLTSWRLSALQELPDEIDKMVNIEPIMNFGELFYTWIRDVKPKYVSIGANTNEKVKLPEPSWGKIQKLIKELKKFTEVRVKDNLERLKTKK